MTKLGALEGRHAIATGCFHTRTRKDSSFLWQSSNSYNMLTMTVIISIILLRPYWPRLEADLENPGKISFIIHCQFIYPSNGMKLLSLIQCVYPSIDQRPKSEATPNASAPERPPLFKFSSPSTRIRVRPRSVWRSTCSPILASHLPRDSPDWRC